MINTITLKNIASYSSTPVIINTNGKKINLFYGLNGSGKSTIGKYLQSIDNVKYRECSITTPSLMEDDILVYNQDFIKNNFYEIPDFQGVFTLSETNKEVELAIEDATRKLAEIDKERQQIQDNILEKNKAKIAEENTLKEAIWKAKNVYENTELDFCLTGYKARKEVFLKKVREHKGITTATIESLKKEAKELSNQDGLLMPSIPLIKLDVIKIENDSVLSEVIIGSKDSYLSELIEKIGNSDWVKEGISYLKDEELCPFCQQGMNASITDAIYKLFDDTYQLKQNAIKTIYDNYKLEVDKLYKTLMSSIYLFDSERNIYGFDDKVDLLKNALSFNLKAIDDKYKNPSKSVSLKNTEAFIDDVNHSISMIQSDVSEYNKKITNKKEHLNAITDNFWKIINDQHQYLINSSDKKIELIEAKVLKLEKIKESKKDEVELKRIEIINNRNKITNIDLSILNINRQLNELGLIGFQIEIISSNNNQRYKIVRADDQGDDVYHSLSEGEKTLITFLYFLECSKGATNDKSAVVLNRRIIVIDDPISSLSHNYIYDIASLIQHEVIQRDFGQVFVLTHNLFFFHELLKLKKSKEQYKLYRVTKSKYSQVKDLKNNELKNDYQMYWQVIKDCQSNPDYSHMLPNAMRNILEHYFNFVHKEETLKKVLNDLGRTESEFLPLFRYINRGSHSDAINISDFEGINVDKYIDKFHQVFKETDFENHYFKMMGIEHGNDAKNESEALDDALVK